MKKAVSVIVSVLTLLVLSTAGAMRVNVAKANFVVYLPEIVIKSDGSVEPETEFINKTGNVYTLTASLHQKYTVRIQCSNIIFDGAGFLMNGTVYSVVGYAGPGLRLEGVTNVTVKDIEVIGFNDENILVQGCSNCSFLSLSPEIYLSESNFNIVAENSGYLHFWRSNNNLITMNRITWGLGLSSSNGNVINKNNITSITIIDGSNSNLLFENNFLGSNLFEFHNKANSWDNGSIGNYWVDYSTRYPNASEIDSTGIGDTAYVIDANNTDHYPLMAPVDIVNPSIQILSPENRIYDTSSCPLNFAVNEPASQITYSLNGEENITIAGNTTLVGLTNGNHTITVYAWDEAGNVGTSEPINFTVDVPFPTTLTITASAATAAVIGTGLLAYFKKHKH